MNLCILTGKIISEIEFKFIINSKNTSIAYFGLELSNKSIVRIIGYNEVADYIYRYLVCGDRICVAGQINSKGCINLKQVDKIIKNI